MKPSLVRFGVLLWMCLFAMLAYLQRGSVAVPADLIQQDLQLSNEELAQVMSSFFWAYALLQVPAGWLADAWGSRRAVTLFVLLGSAAMVFQGLAESLLLLVLARILLGISQAGLFPAAVNSFGKWFPPQERAFPNGLLGSAMSVGGMVGGIVTGYWLRWFTWREFFVVLAVPGAIGAVWFFTWFRDRPAQHTRVNPLERDWIESQPTGTGESRGPAGFPWSWSLLWICGQQFFRAGGNAFFFTFFPSFLRETHGVGHEEQGWMLALALGGMMLGSAVGGRIMDWIFQRTGDPVLSRHGLAIVCMISSVIFLAAGYFAASAWTAVAFITLSSWGAGMAGPAAYTVCIELGKTRVATAFSIMNMAGNIGAALTPPVLVLWVNRLGWETTLLLMAGIYFAALGCWIVLWWLARTPVPDAPRI